MKERTQAIRLVIFPLVFLVFQPITLAIGPLPSSILFDGDFEEVRAGSAPDCYPESNGSYRYIKAAGAWNFNMTGVSETGANTWELTRDTWSVVAESEGPLDGTGNSLHAMADGLASDASVHLLNAWRTKVQPEAGQIIRVSFDIYMPDVGSQGGSILISGNQSGYGYNATTDRAAQISFDSTGAIQARVGAGDLVELKSDVPYGIWQSMRVDLDVSTHTYAVYWSQRGNKAVLLAEDLPFRAADLEFLDHISLALWGVYGEAVASYWDNFLVEVIETVESGD